MDTELLLEALTLAAVKAGIPTPRVVFDFPSELSHGDLTTNLALVHAKEVGDAPRSLAEKVVANLPAIPGIELVNIAGPGFINFTYTKDVLTAVVHEAHTKGEQWGEGEELQGATIMVEHSQPNPFKPFHIGHLMSNTIGESLVRLLENQQARVIRANYQGDVGLHIAKAIWGMQKLGTDPKDVEAIGKAYAHGAQLYEKDDTVKGEIDALNMKVYEKTDGVVNELYDLGREASLKRFDELYSVLGSSFDRFYFESETAGIGQKVVEAHPDIFPLSEGARVFKGEEYGLHTRVFLTSKGLPTYEAKELGLETLKSQEYPECDEFIITTAVEQKGVFLIIKKALEIINPALGAKLSHISHGMMLLPTGKMSSRTGEVVTGESLLIALVDKARERAKESRAEDADLLAQQVAVAAIKFQILKQAAGKDAVFEEERALSLDGDSGPYLQYAHARCVSIFEKAKEAGVKSKADAALVPGEITRLLVRFPQVVQRAAEERAAHHIATYLIQLAGEFNSWYAREQFIDGTDAAPARIALVEAVQYTLRNGLALLGIQAPLKM